MMPVLHSPLDIETAPRLGARARLEHVIGLAFERDHLRQRVTLLSKEIGRLIGDVERLRQENRDLRDAAAIWIRMYEQQLSRANEAARLLGDAHGSPR
jgi:hypothetical protein